MMTKIVWNDKLVEQAIDVLQSHEELGAAILALSKKWKRTVTRPSLDYALNSWKRRSATFYLRKPVYVHPVDQQERREEVRRDRQTIADLTEELRVERAKTNFISAMPKDPPRILASKKISGVREMTAVAVASDWHVEERVRPESIAGRNEYNLDIADYRIRRFFQGITWHIEHQRASGRIHVPNLVLGLIGDLMTGYIHEELQENNFLSPTETMVWLTPRLSDNIETLQKKLDIDITIPCCYGNHGRTTKKPRIESGYANSYEWLMYKQLEDKLSRNKRIRFQVAQSAHNYVEVYDRVLHFTHGDELKYGGGIGGLGIPLLKRVPMWDRIRPADVHILGHFHQLRDYGRAVVNGSLIGYNAYAMSIGADFEKPQQALFYVDAKHGKCMQTAIWVE